MPNLTNAEIALASICIVFALSIFVWLDRYIRRRSAVLNADHLARMQAQAGSYTFDAARFRSDRWEVKASEWSEQAFSIAGARVHSFSRRRVVRDGHGRVMAVHYEEILAPDFNQGDQRVSVPQAQRTLLLAPAA